jgi:alkaline phosphatase
LLELGAVAGATAGLAALPAYAASNGVARRSPKNIVFLVADGMSSGALSLAEPFSQVVRQRPTAWQRLLADPNRSRTACSKPTP